MSDQKLSDALARYEASGTDMPDLYWLRNAVREWDVARRAVPRCARSCLAVHGRASK